MNPEGKEFSGFLDNDTGISASQLALAKVLKHSDNATMKSLGSNTVVLIEPKTLELMRNPLKLAVVIDSSPIKELQDAKHVKETRTNKKRNLIIVEFYPGHEKAMETLLKLDKLGEFEVEVYQPRSDILKYGVISPIDPEIDPKSLMNLLKIKEPADIFQDTPELIEISRLPRKQDGGWVDSDSLKLTYKCTELPRVVSIYHSRYKVRPYIGPPLQCYNCQRMSHTAKGCNNKTRCMLCSGPHKKDQCHATFLKCANCGGEHPANSKECQYFSIGKKIEEVRVKESLDFSKAKTKVLNKIKNPLQNIQATEPSTSSAQDHGNVIRTSYRNKLVGEKTSLKEIPVNTNMKPSMKDQATQVDSKYDDDFFAKLTKCFMTVLGNFNASQDKDAASLSSNIDKVLRETFTPSTNPKRPLMDANGTGTDSQDNSLMSECDSEISGDFDDPNFQKTPRSTRPKRRKKGIINPRRGRGH